MNDVCQSDGQSAVLFCLCRTTLAFYCEKCGTKHKEHESFPVAHYLLFQKIGPEELKRRYAVSERCQAFLDGLLAKEAAIRSEAKVLIESVRTHYENWLEGNQGCVTNLHATLHEETALLLSIANPRLSSITEKLHDKLDCLAPGDEQRFVHIPEEETLKRLSESCQWACSKTPKTWQAEYEESVLKALNAPQQKEGPETSPLSQEKANLGKPCFIQNWLIMLVVFSALLNVLQIAGLKFLSSSAEPEFPRISGLVENSTSLCEGKSVEFETLLVDERANFLSFRQRKDAEITQLQASKALLETEVKTMTSQLADLQVTIAQERTNSTMYRQMKEAEVKELKDSKTKLKLDLNNETQKVVDLQVKVVQEQANTAAIKQEYSKYKELTDLKIKELEDDKRWHEEKRRERQEHKHHGNGGWH